MKGGSKAPVGWRGKVALVAAACLLALLIGEAGARWLFYREFSERVRLFERADMMLICEPGKEYEFRLKPNHSGSNVLSGWTWRLTTNSRGFRGREIDPKKAANVFRIVFVGDSVTFGVGVEDEEVFPRLLEKRLNGGAVSGRKVECVNLGVPGYNTTQEYWLLREQFDEEEPDLVVLVCRPNDAEPQYSVPRHPRRELKLARSWLLERARSSMNDLFHGGAEHYPSSRLVYDADWLAGFEPDSPKRREARESFGRIADFCRKRKTPLLSVYVNTSDATLLDDTYRPIREAFADWAKEEGVKHIDLFDAQAAHDFQKIWTNGDPHPNALGHRVIADGLLPAVEAFVPGRARAR